jgi:hypothetical protein
MRAMGFETASALARAAGTEPYRVGQLLNLKVAGKAPKKGQAMTIGGKRPTVGRRSGYFAAPSPYRHPPPSVQVKFAAFRAHDRRLRAPRLLSMPTEVKFAAILFESFFHGSADVQDPSPVPGTSRPHLRIGALGRLEKVMRHFYLRATIAMLGYDFRSVIWPIGTLLRA